jgi:hypothetical protein
VDEEEAEKSEEETVKSKPFPEKIDTFSASE